MDFWSCRKDERAQIEDKIKRTKLSKEAREKARHELNKLRQMSMVNVARTRQKLEGCPP